MSFGSTLETVGKDIVHGIEYPFKFAVKAEKVLATIIKDDPQAKVILTALVAKAEVIGQDGLKDIGEKGLNLADDSLTIAAVEDLYNYVKATVIPFIESAYGELVTDVNVVETTTSATGQ